MFDFLTLRDEKPFLLIHKTANHIISVLYKTSGLTNDFYTVTHINIASIIRKNNILKADNKENRLYP